MARTTRRDWLVDGCRILGIYGADGLTIEALTQRLGVTKGSFYHHFGGMQGYVEALLAFYEAEGTLDVIAATEAGATAREKLRILLGITTRDPLDVEVGFRAWALRDAQVREVQARIDARRRAYLGVLCRELTPQGETMADLLYLVYVGSQQVVPALSPVEMQRLYRSVTALYAPDEP